MGKLFKVEYELSSPFVGQDGVVTPVTAGSVSVTPTVDRKPPFVVVDPKGRLVVKGDVELMIRLISPFDETHPPNVLYPAGISVKVDGVPRRADTLVFPEARVVSGSPDAILQIVNQTLDPVTTHYRFAVMFQDSHGEFGTLDPIIINDEGGTGPDKPAKRAKAAKAAKAAKSAKPDKPDKPAKRR